MTCSDKANMKTFNSIRGYSYRRINLAGLVQSENNFGLGHGHPFKCCNYDWKESTFNPGRCSQVNTETLYKRPPGVFS